ncbi:MAG: hypothetical protein JSW34_01175 [Candidatus Zixiibacteriota bacterium]|nr:MAG: hypothetical protein JSW34_01175 [candidate division Zixibacteria bacterium]
MKEPLARLTDRTASLGNYHRKYLHVISSNIDKLTLALEQVGTRDKVHLWTYSLEVPGEMDTVLEVAKTREEKLDFLGCYFGLQFLHMNLRMVDIFKLELATSPERWKVARRLMLEAGRMFRNLTKCYMERLLRIFFEDEAVPEFAMLGVGTRADQDDIDLGIIQRSSEDSEILNRAIGRLSSEMFKKSTRLHFHLSEHVGEHSLAATIEDYEDILDRGLYDFVIVTEMLGAATILGSQSLFEDFKKRVTSRFYFDPKKKENRFHEGYLRGILGEIRSLLTRLKPPETINPKDDGLRPIKSLLSALKLVHGIDKPNAWNIIDDLKLKSPERREQYEDLEETLSFFEIFRHLYQIMVAQDEDILLNEPGTSEMVANIARIIGFEKKGVVTAKDVMLVNYYESLEKSMKSIDVLLDDLRQHLREVTIFQTVFSGDIEGRLHFRGNLAVDFVRASNFVKGITYWDDFHRELSREGSPFYDEFINSFRRLPERVQRRVAQGYVAGIEYDASSVLRFLVILGRQAKTDSAREVFDVISRLFIKGLGRLPNSSAALAHMLINYPDSLNSFLALLDWDSLAEFARLTDKKPASADLLPAHRQLHTLADVHFQSSHFFRQHFHQILNKYPVFIRNLYHDDKLKEITDGSYSDLTSLSSLPERLERLGDYYDLEFVRVALLAMSGAGCEQTDAEFIEFCDNYTHSLYEFCSQDVHLSLGYSMHTHDLFALYAAGGHAREQGFDDDYDMIVILYSVDKDEIDYCNKIVGKMNMHILKRGIFPHHRFADHFGSYVISFEQLADFLGQQDEHIFVDQSQVLCSRMLVGTSKLEQKLQEQIIQPRIFAGAQQYLDYMKAEMSARHAAEDDEVRSNIKECRGGLRDIEMLLLMYETKFQVREPLSRKFLRRLMELEPENAEKFQQIEDHLNFAKNLRDVYRLKVAAHYVIGREYLPSVAESMGYGEDEKAGDSLYEDFLSQTDRAGGVIGELASKIRV